jgi:cell wall-associated NlpC family hydrolase
VHRRAAPQVVDPCMPRLSSISVRLLVAAALATLAVLVAVLPAEGQNTQQKIASTQDRAAALKAAVAVETRRLGQTNADLDAAQARLDRIEADADRRETKVREIGAQIAKKRIVLQTLENRMRRAAEALRKNLVSAYENPQPDLVSFLMQAHSFGELIESRNFLKRIQANNARILDTSRDTRRQVDREATALVSLQNQARRLAEQVQKRRDAAQVARSAILNIRARQLQRRDGTASQLAGVRDQIAGLRKRERQEAARAAKIAREAVVSGIGVDTGGLAQAPAGAPAAVAKVMAAGNAIAGLPYLYGGGHASFQASAYDCSGSVSYALAAAGLVSSPMASGPFMSWGEPGPGKWITVYANAGHAYMVVAGWRFDTSALSSGGTRWSRELRSNAGFVARHPPGL